ncbi:MAG: hypothetical protein WDW38_011288 [Sanguina aurantia]
MWSGLSVIACAVLHRPSGHLTFHLRVRSLSQPAAPTSSPSAPTAAPPLTPRTASTPVPDLTPTPTPTPAASPAPGPLASRSSKLLNLLRSPSLNSGPAPASTGQALLSTLAKTLSIKQPDTPAAGQSGQTPASMKHSGSVPSLQHTDRQQPPQQKSFKRYGGRDAGSALGHHPEEAALDIEQIKQSLLLLEGSNGQASLASLHCAGRDAAGSDSSDDGHSSGRPASSSWWSWWKGRQHDAGPSHDTKQVHDAIWQLDSVAALAEMAEDLLSQRDEWRERAVRAETSAAHAKEDVEVLRGQRRLMSEALRAVDEELRRYQRGDVTHALIAAKMEAAELQAEVEELRRESRNSKRLTLAGTPA